MDPTVADTRSIGGLVRGILIDVRTLLREEIELARVEIREQAGRAKAAALSFGIAAGAVGLGGIFLLVALAIGVADLFAWPLWAGFLTMAVVLAIIGAITFVTGREQLKRVRPVPEETVSTLKENSEWIAKRLSSAPR